MKAASVQSPVRQCTSLEKERRVGKPPTPQECNDVGEAARRQQEWTGQVETLQTEKEEEGVRVGLKHHQSTSAALHQSHDAASRQSCSVVLFHWATATPRHRVTSGTVDPPPAAAEGKASKSVSEGEPGFVVVCVDMAVVISDPSTGKYASRADNGNEANRC